ncbi:hypothetical protein CGCVW01_v012790, partial [Colletotrichum viniferum]
FFKFIIVLKEKVFILKFIDIIFFFSNKLSKTITILKIVVIEVAIEVSLRAILALKYLPVRVIQQLIRCASRRQNARKKS